MKEMREAQALAHRDKTRGLAALNGIFRAGSPPNAPLDGRYRGGLVALHIAPGLTQFLDWLTARWLPWGGKTFNAARSSGDNIFTRDSLGLARVYWPFYRGYVDDSAETYRAFEFRTRVAPGLVDPDRQVLKIDYDLPVNPRATIARVLDEIVQVSDGIYLGKAHMHWWWDKWQLVAYFSLSQ